MLRQPCKEEFVLDGPVAYHAPTGSEIWYPFAEQGQVPRSFTFRFQGAGDYDMRAVLDMAGDLLYAQENFWKCPLCSGVFARNDRAGLIKEFEAKCKLKDHSIGYECIAFRQEDRAKELLARN